MSPIEKAVANCVTVMWSLACCVCGVVAEMRQIHMDFRVLWRKTDTRPFSQGASASTLALTGFYCFSGHITLRMVLIYYAQVHFRWLHFTENKREDVPTYIKKEGYLQM